MKDFENWWRNIGGQALTSTQREKIAQKFNNKKYSIMKNKIREVQEYFMNKIIECDFNLIEINFEKDWVMLRVSVDGYKFIFSIHRDMEMVTPLSGFIDEIKIPADRLENIRAFIEAQKEQLRLSEIEKLQNKIAELKA